MTARSTFSPALFALGLLASTCIISPAKAAVHDAQTIWAVNKVVSASSGSYCTMAQRYDDDTVVTVARNQAGEYSLAFDFIKSYFPGAKPTSVSVQPHGATEQTFQVQPQSDKIVVIGIGANDSFMQAMKGASKLDFKVGGQTQTFNTIQFAEAADELTNCVASMQAPAVAPQAPVQVAQAPAPAPQAQAEQTAFNDLPVPTGAKPQSAPTRVASIAPASGPVAKAEPKVEAKAAPVTLAAAPVMAAVSGKTAADFEAENNVLRQALTNARADLERAEAQLKNTGTSNAELQKAKADLAATVSANQALQAQLETTNRNLADLQAKATQAPAVTAQVDALQKQNAQIKAQLDAANQTVVQLQSKSAQAEGSSAQMAALQKQSADMKQQLDAANQTVAQLQVQLTAAQNQPPVVTASAADLKDLRGQLEMAKVENQGLKGQVEQLQSGADQKLASAAGSNWDLEQATRRYQESQREIRRLGALIQSQKTEFKNEKESIEAQLFDPAIADQAQIAKLDALQQRIAELESGQATGQMANVAPAAGIDLSEGSKAPATAPIVHAAQVTPVQAAPVSAAPQSSAIDQAKIAELQLQLQHARAEQLRTAQIAEQKTREADMAKAAANVTPAAGINAPVASPAKVVPVSVAAVKPPEARAIVAPVAQVTFKTPQEFNRMLKEAGLNLKDGVETMPSTTTADYSAYRWRTDSLFGSVEQRAMKGGNNFDTAVQQYLDRAESRCNGDFAAMPADVAVAADKSKAFEIACMGGKVNSTASVLFTYSNDVMMTIAHEGKSDAMDTAMEARDRVANHIGGMKTASR